MLKTLKNLCLFLLQFIISVHMSIPAIFKDFRNDFQEKDFLMAIVNGLGLIFIISIILLIDILIIGIILEIMI